MRRRLFLSLILLPGLVGPASRAASVDAEFSGSNDFGDVGLLQTPTARMRADGEFGLGVSSAYPYSQLQFYLQPLPWLETSIHYTEVLNRPYNVDDNRQHKKDRSLNFKLRLLEEGQYHPALAVGVQDLGGTGLFSSEYLVGDYHFYDLDFSLGLAWGRMGERGGISNPLGIFGSHFSESRQLASANSPSTGGLGLNHLFTGPQVGPIGGVQWLTPVKGLALRVEYDGNDYQHEALGNKLADDSPVNASLEYRGLRGMEFSLGYERGNTLMARINLGLNLISFHGVPKTVDPKPEPVRVHPVPEDNPAVELPQAVEKDFIRALKKDLNQQGFIFDALTYVPEAHEVQVWFSQPGYRNPARSVGRVARALSNTAPDQVERFTVVNLENGVETYRVEVPRDHFEKVADYDEDPATLMQAITIKPPQSDSARQSADAIDTSNHPAFAWGMGPALRQQIGGPDSFYFYQVWWRIYGTMALTDHWSLSSEVGLNIYNNFNRLELPSDSSLPHVRSDIVQYLKYGKNNLVNLRSDYIWSPLPQVYARGSAGLFEEMYAGVAAQVLWRPYGSNWAVGVDINKLRQRGYSERFDFKPYTVVTGFVDLYYKLPFYGVQTHLAVGRYLARDKGATFDISRQFASGVRAGAFATRTNVSAARFGEGSFDKGVYISIPLDLLFAKSSRDYAGAVFRPVTRDGGQRAVDGPDLFDLTENSDPAAIAAGWGEALH